MVNLRLNRSIGMKKTVWTLLFAAMFASCTDTKQKNLTASQIHAQVDSLVGARMDEINRQAMEDLDHRIAIEVKAKADSIVAARTGHIDTVKKQVPTKIQPPIIGRPNPLRRKPI